MSDGFVTQGVSLGRHVRFLGVAEQLDQLAFLRFAGDNGRPLRAALEYHFARGQIKRTFGLLAAVAFHAIVGENRAHVIFENLQPLGHLLGMIGANGRSIRLGGKSSLGREQEQTHHDAGAEPATAAKAFDHAGKS